MKSGLDIMLSASFIVPSMLNVLFIMIPVTVFSNYNLSIFKTILYSFLIYLSIILITFK
jgi:hypothetical protein